MATPAIDGKNDKTQKAAKDKEHHESACINVRPASEHHG